MSEQHELTLRSVMNAQEIDLRLFFSVAMQVAKLLGERHQSELGLCQITPEDISVQIEEGELTVQRIDPQQSTSIARLAYLSPEQTGRMKRKIDQRSDLYVLGVLFYELLTGEFPFKAETANDWIHAHMAVLPVPPRTVKSEIPQPLSDVVMKLLSKSVEHRYQNVYGLLDDLSKCSDQWLDKGTIDSFPLGELDERGRFQLPDKLYNREQELQKLIHAFDRACSGSKQLWFIGGHAGSGKSKLVKAVRSHVMQTKGHFILGKCDPLQQFKPYSFLIMAFRDLIRQILAGGEEQLARWRTKLLSALGQSGNVLVQVISELTLIIGEQPPVEELSPVEATNRFQTLFGNLIKAFADGKHPLVIGLDDLQWADSASLQLIRDLWNHASLKHVLIIGTYRDNELDEKHAFRALFLDPSDGMNASIHYMKMNALGYSDVIRYVADTLNADPDEIKPMAEVLYQQTAGNPLYFKQMLQAYYDRKLLYFRVDRMHWEWDIQGIREMESLQDVSKLIMRKFETLPKETRDVLRFAGCTGSTFDVQTLSLLCEKDADDVEQDLLPAVSEGLILVEEDRFMFLHDQVQIAAYDLLSEDEKKRVHLKVGRSILRSLHLDKAADQLFEVVHHLNEGSTYMTDPTEVEQLARLNLQAGRKAKVSAAYAQALELLKQGARLIEAEGWSRQDGLYFQLMLESTECHYFCGYIDQAEADLQQLLQHVEQVTDRAKIYVVQIMMYSFQKRMDKAAEIALQAMAEFGFSVPTKSSSLSILAEVARTQLSLSRQRNHLQNLPMSSDPLHKALAEIVMASSSILFIFDPELAVILFARYVRMSLNHGLSEAFSIALGSYAITMAFGFGRYRTALRLVEAAGHYADQSGRILLKGKIQLILALILQYRRPKQLAPIFENAGRLSLEGGDLVYAGDAISCHIITESIDLRRLDRVCNTYEEWVGPILDEMALRVLHLSKQYVRLLQQKTDADDLTFNNDNLNEDRLLKEEALDREHKGNLYYFYTCKLEVQYIYGRYSEAAKLAEQSEHLGADMLLSIKQRHCFYYALAMMAINSDTSNFSSRNYQKKLRQLLDRMKRWTKVVPESTLAQYCTMQAEYARLNREHGTAAKLYDQAILHAREAGEPRDEAIATELAANFHMRLNDHQKAEAYLRNACEAYFRWGAIGKLRSLQERYPALAELSFREGDESEANDRSTEKEIQRMNSLPYAELGNELDMDLLRQASQIQFEGLAERELLDTFLQLAIHSAGAEKGLVLLGKQGELTVEAVQEINRDPERSIDRRDDYAAAVVQFVMRTRESVVLGEARYSLFATDPYIQQKRPRSVLCLPVRYPDHQDGVLYLENNLTSDAFTADRLEVLEMLFSRMVYLRLWQLEDYGDSNTRADRAKIKVPLVESLTNREMELISLMADGLSNNQIAMRLEITEGTVKSHVNNIYGKLQVNKRVQAIKKARELQLLS
ncbi:AAA family ATPase [Cohnella suwonensis]|uniref:AAA family ATPase n=1 Tax=Cohnella suwonensis TaxID=696072 RepID=A0ABW0LWA9_9BACL